MAFRLLGQIRAEDVDERISKWSNVGSIWSWMHVGEIEHLGRDLHEVDGGGTIFVVGAAPNVGATCLVCQRSSFGAEKRRCSPYWGP